MTVSIEKTFAPGIGSYRSPVMQQKEFSGESQGDLSFLFPGRRLALCQKRRYNNKLEKD